MLDKTTVKPKTEHEIIIIKETPLKSFLVDATTYVLVVAVIGTGWLMGSAAMEWAGFVILCMCALAAAGGKKDRTKTIAEARAYLDELEKK